MKGCQAFYSGLLGREPDISDKMFGKRAGHPMPGIEVGKNEIEFGFPTQDEINEQGTEFLYSCLELNSKIELFGLPHNKGWINERPVVLQIRQICVSEKNRYEAWKLEHSKDLEDRE